MAGQIQALRLRVLRAQQSKTKQEIEEVLKAVSKLGFNTAIHLPDGFYFRVFQS